MGLLETAREEYETFNGTYVREEICSLWRNGRWVQAQCEIVVLGKPAAVTPSQLPLVPTEEEKVKIQGKCRVRVLSALDKHGPLRLMELQRITDISRSTLHNTLRRCRDIESVREGGHVLWRIADKPRLLAVRLQDNTSTQKVASYLRERAPMTVAEIVAGTDLSEWTVRSVLYRKRTINLFRRAGQRRAETHQGGWVEAALWGLTDNDMVAKYQAR